MNDGWIGDIEQVLYYLGIIGADKDEHGNFIITGEPPCVGLDGREVVLSSRVQYMVGGRPVGLAAGLRDTSYGVRVTVI